jgi:hypothetical protein
VKETIGLYHFKANTMTMLVMTQTRAASTPQNSRSKAPSVDNPPLIRKYWTLVALLNGESVCLLDR